LALNAELRVRRAGAIHTRRAIRVRLLTRCTTHARHLFEIRHLSIFGAFRARSTEANRSGRALNAIVRSGARRLVWARGAKGALRRSA
jgi:hypothetical protein